VENIPWQNWTRYVCARSKLSSFLTDYANIPPDTDYYLQLFSKTQNVSCCMFIQHSLLFCIKPAYFNCSNYCVLCGGVLTFPFGLSVQYEDLCNLLCDPLSYHIITESQNHNTLRVGRDLCGSSSPTPLPKQGHLQQAAQDHVQAGLESEKENPQPPWAACSSAPSPSEGRSSSS